MLCIRFESTIVMPVCATVLNMLQILVLALPTTSSMNMVSGVNSTIFEPYSEVPGGRNGRE